MLLIIYLNTAHWYRINRLHSNNVARAPLSGRTGIAVTVHLILARQSKNRIRGREGQLVGRRRSLATALDLFRCHTRAVPQRKRQLLGIVCQLAVRNRELNTPGVCNGAVAIEQTCQQSSALRFRGPQVLHRNVLIIQNAQSAQALSTRSQGC